MPNLLSTHYSPMENSSQLVDNTFQPQKNIDNSDLSPEKDDQIQQNKDLYDLHLFLEDNVHRISMKVYQNVLAMAGGQYFNKLLIQLQAQQLVKPTTNEIPKLLIVVPNAHIAYDIIMSFYGQNTNLGKLPQWYRVLASIWCRKFWNLNYVMEYNLIKNLEVPPAGFDLLIKTIALLIRNATTTNLSDILRSHPVFRGIERINFQYSNYELANYFDFYSRGIQFLFDTIVPVARNNTSIDSVAQCTIRRLYCMIKSNIMLDPEIQREIFETILHIIKSITNCTSLINGSSLFFSETSNDYKLDRNYISNPGSNGGKPKSICHKKIFETCRTETYDGTSINSVANCVVKNLPEKYDLSMFPKELVPVIVESLESCNIIYEDGGMLRMINTINELSTSIKQYNSLSISSNQPVDSKLIIVDGQSQTINILDTNATLVKKIKILQYFFTNHTINAIYSPDGRYIALTIANDVYIVDPTGAIHINCKCCSNSWRSVNISCDNINCLCNSPSGEQIAFANSRDIQIWDIPMLPVASMAPMLSMQQVSPTKGSNFKLGVKILTEDPATCICYSPDGSQLISGDNTGGVKIWNVEKGHLVTTLISEIGSINCLCYSPNRKQFACGSGDGLVRIWDVSWRLNHTLNGPKGSHPTCISYSSNSMNIVSGYDNGTIIIWNALTGSMIKYYNTANPIRFISCPNNSNYEKISQLKKLIISDG